MTEGSYTDPDTGIEFKTWSTSGNAAPFTFGLALPGDALTNDATEYIGLLVCRFVFRPPVANTPLTNYSAAKSQMPRPLGTAVSRTACPDR